MLTVTEHGWSGVKNGQLLTLAEVEFDVFLTVDQNMQYTQYLAPPPHYQSATVSITQPDSSSPVDQNYSTSPGKLDVRLSGHSRAVSLPASVVMQSPGTTSEQINGHYDLEQRMYGLGLDASE